MHTLQISGHKSPSLLATSVLVSHMETQLANVSFYKIKNISKQMKVKIIIQEQIIIRNLNIIIMYENMQIQESAWSKIYRSLYLIASISLLTHTMSITYSFMTFKEESAGFISIIVSAVVCFFLSSSHLTIYGISILGVLYLKMLESYYTRSELTYIVAMSGLIIFPFWKVIHGMGAIFDSFPGRVHASMVFGTALIALFKFFPLSIQNIQAFFVAANASALTSPLQIIKQTFSKFNVITLGLTIVSLVILFLLRNRLHKIPFITIFVIIGILINIKHIFLNYGDLCKYQGVDCRFYIIKTENIIPPKIQQIIMLIPAALVMTAVLIFQQFLYLQEFARRGRCYFGEGDLGNIQTETRVLALANTISGCFGGLPICINMFATYENFSFNVKSGFKGTKLVGLMQVPVSYALYSILKFFYEMVPLFVIFVIVALPAIYFLSNMLRIHHRHIIFISILAALNVITHPIIALILAAFISIYDIGGLLKETPAEIILENVVIQGERKSQSLSQVSQKKQPAQGESVPFSSQFVNKVVPIDDDQPESLQGSPYVLYRFTGAVSYLNYFDHVEQINKIIQKYIKPQKIPILFSFRYSQIIDEESLEELSLYVEQLRNEGVQVIFTGLHKKLMQNMEQIDYFRQMQQSERPVMYCLQSGQ